MRGGHQGCDFIPNVLVRKRDLSQLYRIPFEKIVVVHNPALTAPQFIRKPAGGRLVRPDIGGKTEARRAGPLTIDKRAHFVESWRREMVLCATSISQHGSVAKIAEAS